MVAQKVGTNETAVQKVEPERHDVGFCLACGAQISRCGKPFSTDIECHKCHKINVYEESQKPIKLR